MPRYSWEGRARKGGVARGVIDAPSKDAALQKLQSAGVTVTRVEAASGEDEASPAVVEPALSPPVPLVQHRQGESLRDKLFYLGVAAVFTILGVGTAYFAPVLVYDCARDASGAVNCTVHRRMYGLFPLPDRVFPNLVSAEIVSGEIRAEPGGRRTPTAYSALVLVCADGTRWKSYDSTYPIGRSNAELQSGIQDLLDAKAPAQYRGWKGEKVPLVIAIVFLLPAGLMLLALLVKLAVSRALVESKIADL
jgi:hypothetical protein